MKVSLNLVKTFTDVDLPANELIKKIGSQLGEVDGVEDVDARYKGAVHAKIISCSPHPDADKLSVCLIDDGGITEDVERNSDGLIQVVCGAPNAREGIMVVWLPPGAVIPATYGTEEPFTLGARELRGIISNGMLASSKELGMGDNHDGILEIPIETKTERKKPANEVTYVEALTNYEVTELTTVGKPFTTGYGVGDYIIDIENKMFTHRPDCFGVLGVAREIAGITGKQFTSPAWYHNTYSDVPDDGELEVSIETDFVSNFTAVVMCNVQMGDSLPWMQNLLRSVGIRPINNIVDITNYIMYLTGQPLHAYDYDKLLARSNATPKLIARLSQKGEKVKLLDGREVTFDEPAIVIATDQEIVGIGGVMGGASTEVDENTTKIVFEAATFDMYSIRRTAMNYGLFTEAVTRFNKGQSPHQNKAALTTAIGQAICDTGAIDLGGYYEATMGELPVNQPIAVSAEFINSRLGANLPAEQIANMLKNVEFDVQQVGTQLTLTAPFWRTDIQIKEDIVEEVGRMYGYDNLEHQLPPRSSKPTKVNDMLVLKQKIRTSLAAMGANELMTYSFVHSDILTKAGQNPEDSYAITNAISPDLQYYRQTLMPSLLGTVNPNIRAGYTSHAVFEIGKTHNKIHPKDGHLPGEIEMTALVYVGSETDEQPAYFAAQQYLVRLAAVFGFDLEFKPVPDDMDYPVTRPYDSSRSALVNIKGGPFVGIVGEYTAGVSANFKLPKNAAGFEIDTGAFGQMARPSPYSVHSKFPASSQDVTLQTEDVSYAELEAVVLGALAESDYIYKITCTSIYKPDDSKTNTTFAVSLSHLERTLTTDEVSTLIASVVKSAKSKCRATQV